MAHWVRIEMAPLVAAVVWVSFFIAGVEGVSWQKASFVLVFSLVPAACGVFYGYSVAKG